MIPDTLDYEKLSRLLSSLEDEILKMPDTEATTTLNAKRKDIDGVTRLVSAQLFNHQSKGAAPALQTSAKVRSQRSSASKIEVHIALLRRLLMAQPELSPKLHAVFSSGRSPDAEEVEGLIAELMHKGVLPKDD